MDYLGVNGFVLVFRQWGYSFQKLSNCENKVILPLSFTKQHLADILTYIDNPAIKQGTLTVVSGKTTLDSFTYWDSTETLESNNVRYISIGV